MTDKTTEIKVIKEQNPARLEESVNAMLSEGWKLHGALLTAPIRSENRHPTGGGVTRFTNWFIQALVK